MSLDGDAGNLLRLWHGGVPGESEHSDSESSKRDVEEDEVTALDVGGASSSISSSSIWGTGLPVNSVESALHKMRGKDIAERFVNGGQEKSS
ncbi:hypothetical protein CRUP_020483 [Coryphaenoides rupestris]|nr:hypothetical protein CRUP_020483 [Coryphaenoides rupestris]